MAEHLINKTVRLSPQQIADLQEEGERDRRDFSSLVRIAVDELLATRRRLAGSKQLEMPLAGAGRDNGR